jgi:hypothetical protein
MRNQNLEPEPGTWNQGLQLVPPRPAQVKFQLAQPLLLFLQPFDLGLARPAEPAIKDESHNLMQLAAIEKGAVAPAGIDNGTGKTAKIFTVHHLSAQRAWPVPHARLYRRRGSGARLLRIDAPLDDAGLLLALGA